MSIKQHLMIRSSVLRDRVNKYAIVGLAISLGSITIASILVSYQLTGFIDFAGISLAQKTNPALWALDLTPFMFAYWGQSFCYELANTMESMIEDKTRELVNKSSDLELKLHYETNHDHLTNLPNHRLLSQRINQGMKQINKGEELAVIVLHVKTFQAINSKYGSFTGNTLLIQFAEKLKSVLLEPFLLQAYMGMNMVARLQGAEFVILIPRLRKDHHLEDVVQKLLAATSVNFMIDGNSINITTTAGVALYPIHGDNEVTLLARASSSLFYAEKERRSFAIYQEGMDEKLKARPLKIKELSKAITDETLQIMFQPDIELKTEKILGVETLPYFDDAKQGKMGMEKILPLIEGTPVEKQLTHFLLKQSIQQLALWHQAKHNIYVTVSLFDATDTELPGLVGGLLKQYSLSPEYLRVELSEKVCLSDQTHTMVVLQQLAELGVNIIISDFCSGYSSFIYLTNFPVSGIKIDKSFIVNMMDDEKKLNIVRAVIKLAAAMNLMVYADGIVDQPLLKKLKQLGCLYGQGSYFSPPIAAEDVTTAFAKEAQG